MDIFQGKITVAEVSRKYDLTPLSSKSERKRPEGVWRFNQEPALEILPLCMYEEKIQKMKEVIGDLTLVSPAMLK